MRAALASVLSCRLAGGLQADTNTNRTLSSVEGQECMQRARERLGQGWSGGTRGEWRGRCKALRRSLGGADADASDPLSCRWPGSFECDPAGKAAARQSVILNAYLPLISEARKQACRSAAPRCVSGLLSYAGS